jgi:hypothetical protein
MHGSKPFLAVNPEGNTGPRYSFATFEDPSAARMTGSTLGD